MAATVARVLFVFGTLLGLAVLSSSAEEPDPANTSAVHPQTSETVGAAEAADPAPEALAEEPVPPLLAERAELLEAVSVQVAKLDKLTLQIEGLEGEEHLVLLGQIGQIHLETLKLTDRLVANAEKSRSAELETSELDEYLAHEVPTITPYLIGLISQTQTAVLELAATREDLPREQLLAFEERLSDDNSRVDSYYEILLEQAVRTERLGLNGTEGRTYIRTELPARADRISGRIELAHDQIAKLQQRVSNRPDDATASLELSAAKAKLLWGAESLTATVRLLDTLDIPTSRYRQLLIRATGNITEDILDIDVARGLVDEAASDALEWVRDDGSTAAFRLLLFLLIVLVARVLGLISGRVVARALKAGRLKTSGVLQKMLATLTRRAVLALGVLFALSQIGIEIGPLLAGIGIIGFAVGFALQDTLSNFAAGTMLLLYRPFDAGDVIETGGVLGTVDHLSLVSTTLLTFDNRVVIVPNKKIWGDVVTNSTAMDIRRIDLEVGVAYSEKVAQVEALLLEVVMAQPRVLQDPPPLVKVHKLNEASVDFAVRPWTRREDYWNVRWDLNRAIKQRFEEANIEFARPRRHVVVEHFQEPTPRDAR
jgi:small conductance mechanosensitive channel